MVYLCWEDAAREVPKVRNAVDIRQSRRDRHWFVLIHSSEYVSNSFLTLAWAHLSVVSNTEVAEMLQKVSDRYRSQEEEHRARVYSRAAVTVLKQDLPVEEMDEEALAGLENIGKALVEDIEEFVETGSCGRLE